MKNTLFAMPDQKEQEARKRKPSARGLIVTLVLNAVLPFLIYLGMTDVLHQSSFVSLAATTLPPALISLTSLVRQRRINLLAGIALLGIVIGLLVSLVSKDPRLLLVRDAFFAATLGLALLISLCFPKPLTYYASLLVRTSFDPEQRRRFPARWQEPSFRMLMRVQAAIWGVGLLVEAVGHGSLVFLLPPAQFLAISPFVQWGVIGVTLVVSRVYVLAVQPHFGQ
jgi:hypothetical protein